MILPKANKKLRANPSPRQTDYQQGFGFRMGQRSFTCRLDVGNGQRALRENRDARGGGEFLE